MSGDLSELFSNDELKLNKLNKFFSIIDKCEIAKYLDFFQVGVNKEFDATIRSIGLRTDSRVFLFDYL